LLRWLTGELSDDEAFQAEPELSGIIPPYGIDGTWDGFDTFMLTTGFELLFAENPGLREELGGIFAGMGRKPPWESRPKVLR
jgi:hypothetical protein